MPLSNTTQEVLRSSPYWDDYARDKRFHRVLIKPRVPVQTRELNQVQSILQNQIEQVTSSIYREGAAVIGGQQTLSNTCLALQVVRDDAVDVTTFYNANTTVGAIVDGLTSGAKAMVTQVTTQAGSDYSAIIISPLNSTEFTGGESVQFSVAEDGSAITTMVVAPGTTAAPATTNASTFSVNDGVFFLRGHLVDVVKQTVILSTAAHSPSKRIGFTVTETVVSSSTDETLLDPALGSTNYAAPGADRLKLTATLVARDVRNDSIAANADADFVELIRTTEGVIQPTPDRLQHEFIENTLARRTYDESGDYVVKPFPLLVKDHNPTADVPNITGYMSGNITSAIITATNTTSILTYANGSTANVTTLFTSEVSVGDTLIVNGESRDIATITNNTVLIVNAAFSQAFTNATATVTSPDKVNLELGAGTAYVRGFEVRTLGTTKLAADRARTVQTVNNASVSTAFGPYTIVSLDTGMFNINTMELAQLHCVPFASINSTLVNATAGNYLASKIGTARVRGLSYYTGVGDGNTTYKMYLVGAEFETKTLQVNTTANAGDNTRLGANSTVAAVVVNATAQTVTLRQNTAVSAGGILVRSNNAYVGAMVELRTVDGDTLRYPVMSSTATDNTTTLRTHTLTLNSDSLLGTVNTTANVQIIFSDKCIRGLAESNVVSKGATVNMLGKVGLNSVANTMMQSPTATSLLFQYRNTPVDPDSIADESYSVLRRLASVTGNSGSTGVTGFTITANAAAGEIPTTQTVDVWRHMIAVLVSNGYVIPLNTANAAVDSDSIDLSIANTVVAGSAVIDVYAPMDRSTATPRTKTLYTGNTSLASVSVNATGFLVTNTATLKGHIAINSILSTSNNVIGLGLADVLTLQKVYAVKDANTISSNADAVVDVTSRYELDNGQRDWCYDHSSIHLRPGYVHFTTNCSQYLVVVDRWEHSTSTNSLGYFTPDSYVGTALEDIPTFTNLKTQNTVSLAAFADFRPVRTANTVLANTAANPYVATETTFDTLILPTADGVYRADYDFYLARVDRLVITKEKRLQVITGTPSTIPVPPQDSADGITLYLLTFPPYTSIPDVVNVTPFEYRRYTMKDINRLEKRIENLEYYAMLSTMDIQALNNPELDVYDNERFKNGIVTDMFVNDGVANFTTIETTIALDHKNHEMRPRGEVSAHKFVIDVDNSTNVRGLGDNQLRSSSQLISLPYTSVTLTQQPLASKSVNINPFSVFSWLGALALLPPSDSWVDTITRPDLLIYTYDLNDGITSGSFGGHWDSWSSSVSGLTQTAGPEIREESDNRFMDGQDGRPFGRPITQTTTTTNDTTTTTHSQWAETIQTVAYGESDQTRVLDTSISPKMRGADIDIAATNLLPGTTLYATFDGIDVTSYIERSNQIELTSDNAALFRVGDHITSSGGGTARVGGIGINEETSEGVLHVVDVTGVFDGGTISLSKTTNFGDITTDSTRAVSSVTVVAYDHHHGRAQSVSNAAGYWTLILDAGAPVTGNTYVGQVIHFTDGGYASRINLLDRSESVIGRTDFNDHWPISSSAVASSGVGGVKATIRAYDAATRKVTLESVSTAVAAALTVQQTSYTTYNPIRYSIGAPETSDTGEGILILPGSFYGIFRVPGYRQSTVTGSNAHDRAASSTLQFNVGQRVLRLSGNSPTIDTSASANFTSQGSTLTKQKEITKTRTVFRDDRRGDVATTVNTSSISSSQERIVGYWDPLAQTFIVDKNSYPDGTFVTHADLFFAKKGTSGMGVTVQLRPTVNGYPSADIVLASSVLQGSDINIVPEGTTPSVGDATHYTRFPFDIPEYLATNEEYSLVVMSNSNEYEVFVGEIGQKLIGNTAVIAQQPHGGSLFKSQNARTWVAEPLEDLMFVLHRAQFSTEEGYVAFQLANSDFDVIASASYDIVKVNMDYLDFDATRNHSTYTTTTVTTGNVATALAILPNENIYLSERMEIAAGRESALKVRAHLRTNNPHVSPIYDVSRTSAYTIENYIDNGGLYSNGFVYSPGTPNTSASADYSTSGNTYLLTVTTGDAASNTVVYANTNTTGYVTSIYLANAGYAHVTTPTVTLTSNTHFTTQPTFTYVGETSANSAVRGEHKARYTTRSIALADGFDASDLKVYMAASRAPQHNIEVYYKVIATGDHETFAQKSWTQMVIQTEQEKAYSSSSRTKREYEYTTSANTASYTSSGVTFTRFHTFAIKVVLRSGKLSDSYQADTITVPTVSNLRVIALDE